MIQRIDVKKLPLIALSFIIAVFIWASAMEVKNPVVDTYEIKGINVKINNIEKGPALSDMSVIDGENQKINLIVTGRRNDITAIDASKIVASVDVSLISKAGDYSLPVDVDLNNAGISIVEKRPSTLSIYIDEIQSKTLPVNVQISGSVSENAVMGEYTKKPESITITGPKGELDNVVSAVSYVEIPKNETKNFGFRQNIILVDKNGKEFTSSHITKSSQYVDVYIPVLSKSSMQVQVKTTGSLDLRYELGPVTISPSIIGVAGNEDALAAAGNIITETVDITGLTESTVISRNITLPDGVKNVSGINKYEISVAILPRTSQDFTMSRYDLEDIHENNVVTYEPNNITIRIWGTADKLSRIDESSITGVIDLKGQYYEPGTYTVPLGIKVADSSLSGFIAVEGEYTITIEVVDK